MFILLFFGVFFYRFAFLKLFSCVWQGHQGCVNALAWNSNGSLLISGSDDLRVYQILFLLAFFFFLLVSF